MSSYQTPLRDINFTLFEIFDYESHCVRIGQPMLDASLTNAFLTETARFSEKVLLPLHSVGDREGCKLVDGKVITPPGFKEAYHQYCEAGWPALSRPEEYGGQGLPLSLGIILSEILGTPNWAWNMYVGLSQGAMHTIETHGSRAQKQQYLPSLVSGRWTGTMCLTESQAGSDLGLLRTKAEPCADGSYRITGTKIFISSGDHDLAENIIHIVLARLPDAPAGTRGISLFLVPRVLVNEAGQLLQPNQISCSGVEHKMGIHGNATCTLHFDGATGWLLGDANKGLSQMFTFLNLARIGAGLHGLVHGEFGYQVARHYAGERLQMRHASGPRYPDKPADPIIVHPDVRRMLFTQRVLVEGSRMLCYFAALKMDENQCAAEIQQRKDAGDLLGLLTPIVKAFSTEAGFEAANLALQCLGGHGYIREWGLEQNLRDCRIASLYEGTTGIQALDLLGRKVLGADGKTLLLLIDEINTFCVECKNDRQLAHHATQLSMLMQEWQELSGSIAQKARQNPDEIGAAAVDYLMYSGYLVLAYLWLRAGKVAAQQLASQPESAGFYRAKLASANFYFARILPRTLGLVQAIKSGAGNLMSLPDENF